MNAPDCIPDGWSVVASAGANSQLAGLLAGFVFTGFVILFSREGPKNVQTLSLFVVSFVVLGFDSYLFSYVTGSGTDVVCTRVWTVAMIASGLLALGAVALICGIAWLVVDYLETAVSEQDEAHLHDQSRGQKVEYFSILIAAFPVAVQLPATLLVTSTLIAFFAVVFPVSIPLEWTLTAALIPPVGAALVLTHRIRDRRRARRLAAMAGNPAGAVTEVGRSYLVVLGCLLGYASLSPIFTGIVSSLPADWWTSQSPTGLTVTVVILTLLVPVALSAALSSSIPDLSPAALAKLDRVRNLP